MNFPMKKSYWWLLVLVALFTILLAGCGKEKTAPSEDPIVGAYKCGAKYSKTDDGTVQPGYWYFKKNGKLLYCVPQADSVDDDRVWFAHDASHGTWKRLGKNRYRIKLRDDFQHDAYTLKVSLSGDQLTIPETAGWDKEVDSKTSMSYTSFVKLFNKTKKAELKAQRIQDTDDSSSSAGTESSRADDPSSNANAAASADPDEIGRAIYSQVFPSEEVDSVEKDGDRYYVSNEYHSADSTIPFQINGDTVTYWTQDDGDSTAAGQNDVHTVSIDELLGN